MFRPSRAQRASLNFFELPGDSRMFITYHFHITLLNKAEISELVKKGLGLERICGEIFREGSELKTGNTDKFRAECSLKFSFSKAEANQKLLAEVITLVEGSDWGDCGLGRSSEATKEAEPETKKYDAEPRDIVYKVVMWPAGNRVRKFPILPGSGFHITVGFMGGDVHGVPKGILTLEKTLEPILGGHLAGDLEASANGRIARVLLEQEEEGAYCTRL